MASINEIASRIRLLLIDVDGVLTDGKLYNVPDAAGNMVAAEVRTNPVFSVTRTTILFSAARFGSFEASPQYDVSADDQRFLMLRPLPGSDPERLIVVENWFEELKAKSRR